MTTIVRTYIARPGSHLSNQDAQRVGHFLDETFGETVFTAEQIVEAAAPVDSAIHDDFTWDKDEAARLWNLDEARKLVAGVFIVESTKDSDISCRAFHHVIDHTLRGATSGYASDHVVWQREDFSEQVIERAKREFLNWQQRYEHYNELHDWVREQLEKSAKT